MTHVKAMVAGGNLEVSITFRTPPTGSMAGIMAIDLYQNLATGAGVSRIPGTEVLVSFIYQEYSPVLSLETASGTTSLSTFALAGNCLSYTIPLSLLGNDSSMDLFWVADIALGVTADFDRAPDVGVFATDTDEVTVRFTGDTTIRADLADPVTGPGEPDFPNIRRVEAEVVGDTLQLVLTYNHSVENLGLNPGDEGLFVWIGMDTDHSLCTGFSNSEQHPPAFGIDYELRLQIDPPDDSVGAFGLDNDELLGADFCIGDNALLFAIDYKSYALSNDGVTLIYLDSDRDPATGWDMVNLARDTHVGIEYVILTYWNTELLKQVTHLYKCLPPEQALVKNQLTTITMANRLYLTVPFGCIDNPGASVDILLRTASWGGGGSFILLPNDDLPNHGVLTVSADTCECNLNTDTNCDMADWLLFGNDWGRTDCPVIP